MISAVVITKNEEKNIERCIKSLLWCSEIVVVDDYSDDKTVKLAKKLGAKVYQHSLDNDFSEQRNFGLLKAKGDWVLFVDADEVVSAKLQKEIIKSITQNKHVGFYIKRYDVWMGKVLKHGEVGNIKLLRLAKKNAGKWKRAVHEFWDVKGSTAILENPFLHYPHKTIREFVGDINLYSTIHAKENMKEGKTKSFWKIFVLPFGKFFVNYFFKLGFLDGVAGFVMAVFMSFHSFLAWGKLK